jgi:MoaA/NifB/PqqE/SkfB family radical SAM enzyme
MRLDVVTGGASAGDLIGDESQQVFEKFHGKSETSFHDVNTIEAILHRQYLTNRVRLDHIPPGHRSVWRIEGVSGTSGCVFVSHTGEIYPSGFLPVSAGSVRANSLVKVYPNSTFEFREMVDRRQAGPVSSPYRMKSVWRRGRESLRTDG